MQVFYTTEIDQEFAFLSGEEAHHCIHVLRKRPGDIIDLTDGRGRFYKTELTEVKKNTCRARILSYTQQEKNRSYSVHLAIAPPKNPKRVEWLIEKLVEVGVDKITFVICKRSEKWKFNTDRLEKRMIGAMKQSLRSYLPVLEESKLFKDWIQMDLPGQKFIAWVSEDHTSNLSELCVPDQDTCILIGPEGDFTHQEIEEAIQAGFKPTALGNHRLRTETAGLASVLAIHVLNNTI